MQKHWNFPDKLTVLVLGIMLFSCKEPIPTVPKNIYDFEKTVQLLSEAEKINGVFYKNNIENYSEKKLRQYFQSSLNKLNANQDTFSATLQYYQQHPDKMQLVFEEVLARLQEEQTRFEILHTQGNDTGEDDTEALDYDTEYGVDYNNIEADNSTVLPVEKKKKLFQQQTP